MAVLLDIVGSFVIGSLLLLNVLRLNADITGQASLAMLDQAAQNSAIGIAQIMEEDLRKIGFGVATTAITQADSAEIRFLADWDGDGATETYRYYMGDLSEASGTPNPNDRFLHRVFNGSSDLQVGSGVTSLQLSYFDSNGNELSSPVTLANIRQIRVDFTVESDFAFDSTYAKMFMELRVRPKNLNL
jgi:hypothetical protein